MAPPLRLGRKLGDFKARLQTNNLWRHIVRYTVAMNLTLIISVIPASKAVIGPYSFLGPLTAVFGHCGQRVGLMVESLGMVVIGSLLGVAWSSLGLYLASLVWDRNMVASHTIRAIFLVVVAIFHGFFRSHTPRVFNFVLFYSFVSTIMLAGTENSVSREFVANMVYPILCAAGIVVVVNVSVFPEFSSNSLVTTTMATLTQTTNTLRDATQWFVSPVASPRPERTQSQTPFRHVRSAYHRRSQSMISNPFQDLPAHGTRGDPNMERLTSLSEEKTKLRAKLNTCRSVQQECTFEITFSVLPPRCLKPFNALAMSALVQSTISLIGACESKFAMMGNHPAVDGSNQSLNEAQREAQRARPSTKESRIPDSPNPISSKNSSLDIAIEDKVKLVKPHREIKNGDVEVLEFILSHLSQPIKEFQRELDHVFEALLACLAYCFDAPRLPSGAFTPRGIQIEELDIRSANFATALEQFEVASASALETVAMADSWEGSQVDIMPRVEVFLVSSFVLGLRQIGEQSQQMLKHARTLVEKRQARHGRRKLHFPRKFHWRQWLFSGGEQDVVILKENARKQARSGQDLVTALDDDDDETDHPTQEDNPSMRRRDQESANPRPEAAAHASEPTFAAIAAKKSGAKPGTSNTRKLRVRAADWIESMAQSDDIPYALKLGVAIMLVTWPSFVTSTRSWYNTVHGVWAPLQLVLVFEVSIGTSLWVFGVRAAGVVFGCVMGLLSYLVGRGNLPALVVFLQLGIIPSAYVQLGTPYVKAGMISVVSMTVVSLSTVDQTGPAWENFVKRLCAFLVGGAAALLVQVIIYPVRARERLIESISSCLDQVTKMQAAVAVGIDNPTKVVFRSNQLHARFSRAKNKATAALGAADTFLPFCLTEPRLKGNFDDLHPIYKEIIYVLYQIIDRMDNVVQLRRAYGSSVLEKLNEQVYGHRRNVAASVTLALFAVNEALVTKLPLPQFLPSSRLAQVRLIHRVRELVAGEPLATDQLRRTSILGMTPPSPPVQPVPLTERAVRSITEENFLSWSAAAAGQMEIIEYLEELVDLAKLLVGVSAFRAGLLEQPNYRHYVGRIKKREAHLEQFNRFAARAAARGRRGRRRDDDNFAVEDDDDDDNDDGDSDGRGPDDDVYLRKCETFDPTGGMGGSFPASTGLSQRRFSSSALPSSLFRVGTRLRQGNSIEEGMSAAEERRQALGRHGRGKGKGKGKAN
ncbi:uncharacterized protein E0L32_010095 [Thyridium curvatum]|uniref:Uncharacterized protein n=1 Tax=Thyridium curvatum TaxID=1093900 RepID=A0A507AUE1_9PEZI|nr:uncharacterized protein E0L32_010095 [Thyridium curvatum]TPX08478.1 hypothetical protein E0L32_010095 [Thyridium curvatum]